MKTPILLASACFLLGCFVSNLQAYNPLETPGTGNLKVVDFTIHDSTRSRDIPIRVYLPSQDKPAPVILFSHGLGGSRENNAYMGNHWASRGYLCVFLQHQGSDSSLWEGKGPLQAVQSLKKAASGEQFLLRVRDVSAVLDQLELWNKESGHPLAGRMDLDHVGMCGHSFGAITTQAVSGQTFPMNKGATGPSIQAAIAFSPSPPSIGDPGKAFSSVKIPWMLMTGTEDDSPIGDTTPKNRLEVYPVLPPENKYELVLNGAKHSAFSDRALPGDRNERNPNHHRVILALSTAFWDSYLKDDTKAQAWLDGQGPSSVLESKDHWQHK